jgi:ssDNA-binding Zn-finger/Zn-ribbon topoisomerase 1
MNPNHSIAPTATTSPINTEPLNSNLPIPDEITAEYPNCYRVCFKTDIAGIATVDPSINCYAHKSAFAARFPHLVSAWETKKRTQHEEAQRIHRNLVGYAYYFCSSGKLPELRNKDPGVECDQDLLPGMEQHWGELRKCETHWRGPPDFWLCKGCRVAHHMQRDPGFDRRLIMINGARVLVCETCAKEAMADFGVGYRGCVCDSQWTCFRCREDELGKLAKARKDKDAVEKCGKCEKEVTLVNSAEYCLYCRQMRVYAGSSEESLRLR